MLSKNGKYTFVVLAAFGWMMASVMSVLAMVMAAESRHHDVGWMIFVSLVVGSLLACIPIGIILLAARRAFGFSQAILDHSPAKLKGSWITFFILCGFELMVFAVTLLMAAQDDDSLVLTIPLNLLVVGAGVLMYFIASDRLRLRFDAVRSMASAGEADSGLNKRWMAFLILCCLETLVFPLTLIAAWNDDDTLILSVPINIIFVAACIVVGSMPHWRRASIALCIIHLIGLSAATLLAAIEIESVVVTGMVLFFSGAALAIVGPPPRLARTLFASSTVVFVVTAFLVIAIGHVRQREADAPLFAAIVAYQILFVPIGLRVLHVLFAEPQLERRHQFGIKHLLAVTAIVCIAAASTRLAYTVDRDLQVAVGFGFAVLILAGVLGVVLFRMCGKPAEPIESFPKSDVVI